VQPNPNPLIKVSDSSTMDGKKNMVRTLGRKTPLKLASKFPW